MHILLLPLYKFVTTMVWVVAKDRATVESPVVFDYFLKRYSCSCSELPSCSSQVVD